MFAWFVWECGCDPGARIDSSAMWGLTLDDLMGFRAIFSIYLLLCCVGCSVKTCRTPAIADRVGAKAVPS